MPTLTPEEVRLREDLCRKYRIVFTGETRPSEWPDHHRKTLQEVCELSNRKYDTYTDSPEQGDYEPWRAERKSMAAVLTQIAARFHRRNESSWRHACEPIILGRLSAEVCCRACRKRLWRSDIEVSREGDAGVATQLRNRQQARQPCRCPRQSRSQDHLEAVGLNQIFNYRVDEQVNHDPDVNKDLKKKESPDRIYGLRQTRNIENLLNDTVKRSHEPEGSLDGTQVQELLGQPIQQSGDRQLFPFLVLEAKSGTSGSDWHSIQMQTAFSIRTFLATQNRLRAATGTYSKWQSGPLVWFFSNKGEDWRLCAAYVEEGPKRSHTIGTTDYRVVDVWRGCILSLDGALQLLLLVDYIFDWARDIYREDIIRELRVLASGDNDAASVMGTDIDILSYCHLDPFDRISEGGSEDDHFGRYTEALESFRALDSKMGAVRHATFVESRYSCVFITRDNVQTLVQSTRPTIVQQLCQLILRELNQSNPIRTSQQTLGKIEEGWTGTRRLSGAHLGTQPDLFTAMASRTYLDPDWHQVRELFAIAIARDAWPAIIAAAELKIKKIIVELSPPELAECDTDSVLEQIKRLRAGSPQQLLLNAITRRSVRISQELDKSKPPKCWIQESDGAINDVVNLIYKSYKKGTLEPQEPFLRLSKRSELQHTLQFTVKPFSVSQHHKHHTLQTSSDGCVLLTATRGRPCSGKPGANFCVYLTGDNGCAPETQTLGSLVRSAFETRDVYHTARGDRSARTISKIAERLPSRFSWLGLWNIDTTYGVYSDGPGLVNLCEWLKEQDTDPFTQGSSRDPHTCGSQLHQRNLLAWREPELMCKNMWEHMFFLYKLFTTEMAYWRRVAKERKEKRISCCECCAAIGDHEICSSCERVLQDKWRYQWYKNALRGEKPLEVRSLEGRELRARMRAIEIETRVHGVYMRRQWRDRHWAMSLDLYKNLDQPFESIGELSEQFTRFKAFFDNLLPPPLGKRKRSDLWDESE